METAFDILYQSEPIKKERYSTFLLGGDIGGTNADFGIFGIRNRQPELLLAARFPSQKLDTVVPTLNSFLDHAVSKYGVAIKKACLGAAGLISANHDLCQPTNVTWTISVKEILAKTSLNSVFLINDFEAIGYGINLLHPADPGDVMQVRSGKPVPRATRAVIGAGTGLGKSILVYSKSHHAYLPLHSEGGHADFPAQDELELQLLGFVGKKRKLVEPVNYEELLSGRGIESIYLFLKSAAPTRQTKITDLINSSKDKAAVIAKYRHQDEVCRETFRLFAKFYARCAKNFVLDTLAQGGLYIAGGIAARNPDIFKSRDFLDEFIRVNKLRNILQNTPVYVIVNENVGLMGAALAAMVRKEWAIEKK